MDGAEHTSPPGVSVALSAAKSRICGVIDFTQEPTEHPYGTERGW
jgi:hypothetical protein